MELTKTKMITATVVVFLVLQLVWVFVTTEEERGVEVRREGPRTRLPQALGGSPSDGEQHYYVSTPVADSISSLLEYGSALSFPPSSHGPHSAERTYSSPWEEYTALQGDVGSLTPEADGPGDSDDALVLEGGVVLRSVPPFPFGSVSLRDNYVRSRRKMLYHLHVHKSAGTHIFHRAREMKTWGRKPLKLYPSSDATVYRHAHSLSWLNRSDISMVKNEYILPSNMHELWGVFSGVVVVRDPAMRSYSHYSHVCVQLSKANGHDPLCASFEEWALAQPDNFLTRVLCGENCKDVPRGGLTSGHLALAIQRLYEFDVVVDLDNLKQSEEILALFYSFPPEHEVTRHATRNDPDYYKKREKAFSNAEFRTALTDLHRLDFVVYGAGKLYRGDLF